MTSLSPDEARRRFAAARVARLATIRAGEPRVVPVVFAVEQDAVFTAVDHKPKTTRQLKRLADVLAEPRVALLADHYAEDWTRLWWVRADGTARVLDAEEGIDLLVAKYEQYGPRRPDGPVIRIDVTRWTGWSAAGPGARPATP